MRLLARSGLSVAGMGAAGSIMGGCALLRHSPPPSPYRRHGVFIMVDGLRADLFQEMLAAGALPSIQRHLVDRGTTAEICSSTFPSTSGPAHLPFINGRMPGTNNCPGLRWIDGDRNLVRDYCTLETVLFDRDFPKENFTLFEMLSGKRTVCIFDFVSRGAAERYRPSLKTLWFTRGDKVEDWRALDVEAVDVFRKV